MVRGCVAEERTVVVVSWDDEDDATGGAEK